jgi:DDE superfamily endonuclease
MNDISIFQDKLKYCLIPGETVEADKGYIGEPLYCSIPIEKEDDELTPYEKKIKKMKKAVGMRHENINHYFKSWAILKQVYRHPREKHGMVFWAVAVLTQISFDMGEKRLYQLEYIGQTYAEAREYLEEFI